MVGKEEGADFDTYKEKQDRIPRQQEEREGPKCISASLLFPQWVTEPFHFKVFFWWCPIKGLMPTWLDATLLVISVMRTWGNDKNVHGRVSVAAHRWVEGVAKVHPSFIHINSRCLCKRYPVGPMPCLFNSILPFLSLVSAKEQNPLLARYNPGSNSRIWLILSAQPQSPTPLRLVLRELFYHSLHISRLVQIKSTSWQLL